MKLRITTLTALATAALAAGCQGNPFPDPPVHIIQNMDFQQRYDPQERNDFFADGRAMRRPVEGTVARGPEHLKDNDHLYRGRGTNGRLVDALPSSIEDSAELLARGQERYDIYCAPCHDRAGTGHGIATTRGGGFQVQPASLHQDRLRAMPLGYFYDVVTNGKGTMLPYAAQIPTEDRWAISAWVRTLQAHGKAKGWDENTGMTTVASAEAASDAAKAGAGAAPKNGAQQDG